MNDHLTQHQLETIWTAKGAEDYAAGATLNHCPFQGATAADCWRNGWNDAYTLDADNGH